MVATSEFAFRLAIGRSTSRPPLVSFRLPYMTTVTARRTNMPYWYDTDGKEPDEVLESFKEHLPDLLGSQFRPSVQYAYAQWHLEAWYFADAMSLRGYLGGRDLGSVDTSQPDNIQNPKLHLKNLINDNVYTAQVSEEIAKTVNAETVSGRSPSFHGLLNAVKNGESQILVD